MSKIQINQLNTSEFNELNSNETANVVGGRKRGRVYNRITNNRTTNVALDLNMQNIKQDWTDIVVVGGGATAKKGAGAGADVNISVNNGASQENRIYLGQAIFS